MPLPTKLPFYILLFYPIFGYFTINYWGQLPFISLSLFVIYAFFYKVGSTSKLIFPLYQKFFILFILFVSISKYLINGVPFKIDSQFAQILFSILALFFYIIIENSRFTVRFIENSITIMKYTVFIAAGVSVIQYFIPTFFYNSDIYMNYGENVAGYARRIASIFTWSDFNAGTYIAIGFIIMYGILLVEYKHNKTIFFALQILVAIVVLTSQARVAMMTFVIATLILVYSKISVRNILIIVFSSLTFLLLINLLEFNVDYFIENRLKSESAYTRVNAFTAFFHAFPESPFFGTGGERTEALYEGFGHVAKLHNTHLAIAYYYGIFAFIFHTLFLLALTKKTYNTGKQAGYWPPFVGMLCYMSATMTMPSGYFLQPGLIFMMVFNKYHYDLYLMKKVLLQNEITSQNSGQNFVKN